MRTLYSYGSQILVTSLSRSLSVAASSAAYSLMKLLIREKISSIRHSQNATGRAVSWFGLFLFWWTKCTTLYVTGSTGYVSHPTDLLIYIHVHSLELSVHQVLPQLSVQQMFYGVWHQFRIRTRPIWYYDAMIRYQSQNKRKLPAYVHLSLTKCLLSRFKRRSNECNGTDENGNNGSFNCK